MINTSALKNKKRRLVGIIALLLPIAFLVYYSFFLPRLRTTKIYGLGITMEVPNTTISFEKKIWDLEHVEQNKLCTVMLNYSNTGNNPLVVYDVNSSCGCVEVIEWSNMPIAPGKTGSLKLRIRTSDLGIVDKIVSVYSNSEPNPEKLRVKAEICK